jgi:hypothetical protein
MDVQYSEREDLMVAENISLLQDAERGDEHGPVASKQSRLGHAVKALISILFAVVVVALGFCFFKGLSSGLSSWKS